MLQNDNSASQNFIENPEDVHIELTKNFIVIMRRNGEILKLDRKQLT